MNEQQTDVLAAYIRSVADRLGLSEWSFRISEQPPYNPEAIASCEAVYGRRLAVLYFEEGFAERSPTEQRNTVVHELLHCHHAAQARLVKDTLGRLVREADYDLVWEPIRMETEYMVDLLTSVLERQFDLIAWPEPAPDEEPAA